MSPDVLDVAVIGAGVVGAAVARELSRYELRVALVEAAGDVGAGTSKANTAILHTGFDAAPGSLEAGLLRRGYELMLAYADEAGIPLERTGAILVAWSEADLAALPAIREKAAKNGVTDLRALTAQEVYAREPNLGPGALGGLLVPGEFILCPYTPPLAFASQAVLNGAQLFLNSPVLSAGREGPLHALRCGGNELRCRWVVNAAGLFSGEVDAFFGPARFRVVPRRGQLLVFDKLARPLVSHILLPVPTKITKGVLIAPTVFGNVLVGPTAEDLQDKNDTATTAEGLRFLMEKARALMPALAREEVTAGYAGLRAATERSDYQIHFDGPGRYVCAGGIRSTGLSASLGIAEHVVGLIAQTEALRKKAEFRTVRMPPIGQAQERPAESEARIAEDSDYGRVVCHCERVSLGEIRDALRSAIPARSLDGLRRRTRCLQGRCQGFYCLARIGALLEGAAR